MKTYFGPWGSNSRHVVLVLCALALVFASGCASPLKVDDFHAYRDVDLPESDVVPPASALRGTAKRVVVAEPEASSLVGNNPVLAEMLVNAVEMQVESAGARVIRRAEVGSLLDEVRRFEEEGQLHGSAGLDGISSHAADFALLSRVESFDVSSRFIPANVDDKGRVIGGPWCQYTLGFSANARYYELGTVRALATFPLRGQRTINVPTGDRQCSGSNVSASVIQQVVDAAAHGARTDIKNPLAPRGYVVGARSNGERKLFRVSLGREAHLQAGTKLYLYTVRKSVNQLTGASEIENVRIAEARLTDQIGAGFAWVVVEDVEDEKLVRLGDFIQPSYEKGFMERQLGLDPSGLVPSVGTR